MRFGLDQQLHQADRHRGLQAVGPDKSFTEVPCHTRTSMMAAKVLSSTSSNSNRTMLVMTVTAFTTIIRQDKDDYRC